MARRPKSPPSDAAPEAPAAPLLPIAVHCTFDRLVPLANLVPNPRNPNRHPERQVKLLADVIARAGWRAPVTVSERSGYIVKGHGRREAALRLCQQRGEDPATFLVPVDDQPYASAADETADLISDNRLAELASMPSDALRPLLEDLKATPDFDLTQTGYAAREIEDLLRVPDQTFAFLAPTVPARAGDAEANPAERVNFGAYDEDEGDEVPPFEPASRPHTAPAATPGAPRLNPRLPLPILLDDAERQTWKAAKAALGIADDRKALLTLATRLVHGDDA